MIDVNGRLHSTEKNVNVIAGADEILDDSKNKKQNEINTETYSLVNDINERLSGLSPDQQSALSVAAKATNNEIKLGYYVCGTEGNIAAKVISDATGYTLSTGGSIKVKMTNANTADNATLNINSTGAKPLFYDGERASANNTWEAGETVEVYYDGTNFYANNVAGGGGDGVFDVSEKYPTSGVEGGNTYTLEGALTVLNANLPASKKKGGMSIKFVLTSDNKYVQYRLNAQSFSTFADDWDEQNVEKYFKKQLLTGSAYTGSEGSVIVAITDENWASVKCSGLTGSKFSLCGSAGSGYRLWYTVAADGTIVRRASASLNTLNNPVTVTLEQGECYIYMNSKSLSNSYILPLNTSDVFLESLEEEKKWEEYKYNKSIFSRKGYLATNANFVSNSNYAVSEFLKVDDEDVLKYRIYDSKTNGSSTNPLILTGGIFCYDENKTFISRYTTQHEGIYMVGEIAVSALPTGTAYIRVISKVDTSDWYVIGVRDYNINETDYNAILMPIRGYYRYRSFQSNTDINNAISELHTLGGGVLKLGDINWNGATILLNYNDVSIEGSGIGKTFIGGTYVALEVGSGVSNISVSNLCLKGKYKVKKTSKISFVNVRAYGDALNYNEIINGIAPSIYHIASTDTTNPWKTSSYDIIETTENAATKINAALADYDTVYLYGGTYNTTSAIIVNSNNRLINPLQVSAAITRSTNGYGIMSADASSNTYIEGVTSDKLILLHKGNSHYGHLVNCNIYGNLHINDLKVGVPGENNIDCGNGMAIESFVGAKALLLDIPTDVKYKIRVFGKVEEALSATIVMTNTMLIEGMTEDAELAFMVNSTFSAMLFRDYNGVPNKSVVKNLIISQNGQARGWNFAAVEINGNYLYFENCKFINNQSCDLPYSQGTDETVLTEGDRKHGCLINIKGDKVYDENCHTELHNCTGIGSPYGFKNCRGFYFVSGSPKLYNCIGIGGGIGSKGYGMVCHVSSKPYLFNCIGIGSPYGWSLCNGIQVQAASRIKLVNCIGYGGTGYKYISNGGTDIVRQNEISGASHGFGFLMDVSPELIGCMGYAGDGENSAAIYADYSARPEIVGGKFGKEEKIFFTEFSISTGVSYMDIANFGNDNREIELTGIYLRDLSGANISSIAKFVFKVEGITIAESTSVSTENSYFTITQNHIQANKHLELHVEDVNGNDITSGVNFAIFLRYRVSNDMCHILLKGESKPHISKAVFNGNEECDGIIINTDSDEYIIEDCSFFMPPTRKAVKSSSTKTNVKVVDCLFTSQQTENIDSFISVTSLGTNKVLL